MAFYVGQLRAAEFFAGIGLVRAALAQEGFKIVLQHGIAYRACSHLQRYCSSITR